MNTMHRSTRRGFTLIELLVVIAIIAILAGIAFPVLMSIRNNANLAEATDRMKNLGSALNSYVAANNGELPSEDTVGVDDWSAVVRPEAQQAWYNALPKILGQNSPADYVNQSRISAFYQKDNILFLPGAKYPESNRTVKPYFAIAYNTKLHRKDPSQEDSGSSGGKPVVRMANILQPLRTVVFLEQGLPDEPAAHPAISVSSDYDGSCKGSAKSFVTRYKGKGLLTFADGHTEPASATDLLTPTGAIIWDAISAANHALRFIWTADPMEDPN
jgi:prepilin-type N-terminal cleavage/methylation domain-containing protein